MDRPALLQLTPFPEAEAAALSASYAVHHAPHASVRAVATRGARGVERAVIDALPALEIVAVYGVGYDAVALDACLARGIAVTHTPDVLTGDVADMALALALGLSRAIPQGDAWVRTGRWAAEGPMPLTRRLHGRRAGVLGMGRIGRAVAARCRGFDMDVGYCDPSVGEGEAEGERLADARALAEWADVLFVTLAATPGAPPAVDAAVLAALGPEGLLVNVSRASNVDEGALVAALTDGAIAGAALDVMAGEPSPSDATLAAPNLLLSPHHASGTRETRAAMGRLMLDNLAAHFDGRPLPSPVPECRP